MSQSNSEEERLREFDEEILRSAYTSLFWGVISDRRERGAFTLQSIADALDVDKSAVSRWFSGEPPNWELNTVARLANALNLDLEIGARDRATGRVYSAAGAQEDSAPHPKEIPIQGVTKTQPLQQAPLTSMRVPPGTEPQASTLSFDPAA